MAHATVPHVRVVTAIAKIITTGTFTSITTIITTLAAVVALYYAREAVRQTNENQHQAHQWRVEDTEAQRRVQQDADAAHAENIAQLRQLQESSAKAHAEEMAERAKALDADRRLQRLAALQRIADAVGELASIAWDESENPPVSKPMMLPRSRIHMAQQRVGTAVAAYRALGGQPIEAVDRLVERTHMAGSPPDPWFGDAVSALVGVTHAITNESRPA